MFHVSSFSVGLHRLNVITNSCISFLQMNHYWLQWKQEHKSKSENSCFCLDFTFVGLEVFAISAKIELKRKLSFEWKQRPTSDIELSRLKAVSFVAIALLLEKMSIYWWRKRETTSVREVFEVQSSLSSSNFNLLMNLIILGIIVISVVWFSLKSVGLRRFQYRIFF